MVSDLLFAVWLAGRVYEYYFIGDLGGMEAAFSGVVASGPQLCNTGKDQALMLWRMLLAGCLRVFKMLVALVSLNRFSV